MSAQEGSSRQERTVAVITAEAIEGYKVGLRGGPMGFVSGAFDCGWTHGAQDRATEQYTVILMTGL